MDDKGRMAMPARYREGIVEYSGGKVVITIDIEERCLLLYLLPDWEPIEKKLSALPSFNKMARRVQRLIIGHATEVEMDTNGRFMIPAPLRQYAVLEKRIVLVGQGNKFEIWSQNNWQSSRETWLEETSFEAEEAIPEDLRSISL